MKQEKEAVQIDLTLPAGVKQESLLLEPVRPGTVVLLDGQPVTLPASGITHLGTGEHTLLYTPAEPIVEGERVRVLD